MADTTQHIEKRIWELDPGSIERAKKIAIDAPELLQAEHTDIRSVEKLILPPGTMMWFLDDTPPDGWLPAYGQVVLIEDYNDLYNAIGTRYNDGTEQSTEFRLPDLRGEFVRGWDAGRGADASRTMGSWQDWAIENIQGNVRGFFYTVDGVFEAQNIGTYYAVVSTSSNSYQNKTANFDASRVVKTSIETRPRNVALLPIIKY